MRKYIVPIVCVLIDAALMSAALIRWAFSEGANAGLLATGFVIISFGAIIAMIIGDLEIYKKEK